jgi:hypothetical protein
MSLETNGLSDTKGSGTWFERTRATPIFVTVIITPQGYWMTGVDQLDSRNVSERAINRAL